MQILTVGVHSRTSMCGRRLKGEGKGIPGAARIATRARAVQATVGFTTS